MKKTVAALFGLYLALAALRVWPLVSGHDHRLPDEADGAMVAWTLWAVSSGARAFHPHPSPLLYADAMVVPGMLAAPVIALGANALSAANLLVVLTIAASAFAVHLLARALTGSPLAALTAAAAVAFGSFALSNQARLQILGVHWMALGLLALHVWLRDGRSRDAWASAACAALVALSCMYYLPFFGVAVLVLGAGFIAASSRPMRSLPWRAAVLPAVAAAATIAALAWPYLRLYRRYGFSGGTPRPFDLVLYLTPPPASLAYPWATGLRPEGFYLTYFIGYLVLALAVAGAVVALRSRTPERPIWIAILALAIVAAVLSAGPDVFWRGEQVAPGPYRLLMWMPPFTTMREPRRFAVLVILCCALLAARGVAALLARCPRRWRAAIGVALASFVAFEHAAAGDTRGVDMPGGRDLPPVYRWLAERRGPEPIAELPVRPLRLHRWGAVEQYFATEHQRPILTGWPSFPPPALELIRYELRDFPDARSLAMLRALGVRYAVVHPRRWEAERARFERRMQERADVLPVLATFEERPHAVWDRFGVGGEMVVEILPGEPAEPPSPCPCQVVPRDAVRATSSHGRDATLAADGSRETRWTTAPADQQQGMYVELTLDRPRPIARVEIAAAFPYGEFGRYVEVLGRIGGEWRRVGPRADHGALVATVQSLVANPREAWLPYAVDAQPMEAIRLVIGRDPEPGTGPWSIPEVRLLELAGPPVSPVAE